MGGVGDRFNSHYPETMAYFKKRLILEADGGFRLVRLSDVLEIMLSIPKSNSHFTFFWTEFFG